MLEASTLDHVIPFEGRRNMICSEARLTANRQNALKSTGPRTPEGKNISRANALTHGLCSAVVIAEDQKIIQTRSEEFFNTLRPQNNFHCWIVTEVALLSIQIERAERMVRRVRDKISIKAELCWDDDKRLEAELLGEQLGNRPAVVTERLRMSPQGCEWMMARWALLAYSAENKGSWTPAQTQLAFDLLGTPGDFREGHKPGTSIDFRGNVLESGDDSVAVARREVDLLEQRRDLVLGLDQANQALAVADLYDDTDPELKRIRKQEGMLHSRLRWFMAQLQHQSPVGETPRWLKQCWLGYEPPAAIPPLPEIPTELLPIMAAEALPEPVAVEEPKIVYPPTGQRFPDTSPPFDLELHELNPTGGPPNIPQILANRQLKKLEKAEERREARRRKLEELRGVA